MDQPKITIEYRDRTTVFNGSGIFVIEEPASNQTNFICVGELTPDLINKMKGLFDRGTLFVLQQASVSQNSDELITGIDFFDKIGEIQ